MSPQSSLKRWFIACALLTPPGPVGLAGVTNHLQELPLRHIQVHDPFWSPKLEIYRTRTIPWSWQYLASELRALRKAGGEPIEGELNGTWGEANLYKFLETAAYSLAQFPDDELKKRVEGVIALLAGAQQPDGYLHAYVTNSRKEPWDPAFLDGSHDGYVLGHMIEAALAHHAATGERSFLDIARRAADQAWRHFLGPNGQPGFCGHAELEMALAALYRATGDTRYLDLSRAFVEWRGRGKVRPFSETPRAYFQDAVPFRAQRTLDGHAVRAVFFATGVADLALETAEPDYRLAANRFWDSTTLRRMTITGGVGPRKEHEAFGEDYELPNDGYYESCAACGLANFAQRMFRLERRAEAADVLERVLYNAVLHGISLDGTHSYYCNPLSDCDHLRDNCWVCCPPNLSRTLLQVGQYAYAWSPRDFYVNLFVGGTARVPFPAGDVAWAIESSLPWNGRVQFRAQTTNPVRFALHVRKPDWCEGAAWQLNGAPFQARPDDAGYWVFDREWRTGDCLDVDFKLEVQRRVAHPNISGNRGKVALQRGPLVYAFEGIDNRDRAVVLPADAAFQTSYQADLLGGVTLLRMANTKGEELQAVPFYALANRGKSTQEVWIEQAGLKTNDVWWQSALYRVLP
ncbi:MAG: glycoside hydrolase family 127 protein [Verrucomicrobiota bacterium]